MSSNHTKFWLGTQQWRRQTETALRGQNSTWLLLKKRNKVISASAKRYEETGHVAEGDSERVEGHFSGNAFCTEI